MLETLRDHRGDRSLGPDVAGMPFELAFPMVRQARILAKPAFFGTWSEYWRMVGIPPETGENFYELFSESWCVPSEPMAVIRLRKIADVRIAKLFEGGAKDVMISLAQAHSVLAQGRYGESFVFILREHPERIVYASWDQNHHCRTISDSSPACIRNEGGHILISRI